MFGMRSQRARPRELQRHFRVRSVQDRNELGDGRERMVADEVVAVGARRQLVVMHFALPLDRQHIRIAPTK